MDESASQAPTATSAFASTLAQALAPDGDDDDALGRPPHGMHRFEIGREIGRGGMGRILEATDLQFGRRVALKASLRHTAAAKQRFVQEALVTANLQHPGIPPVYERGVDEAGHHFYAMRFIEGRTLKEALAGARDMDARLALVPVVVRTAQTLAYAHERGVVHRDIKPDNVLVGRHGESTVLDWGIAKVRGLPAVTGGGDLGAPIDGGGATRHGAVLGTPYYMAPEQAEGDVGAIDERTDVFALGALLYQVLSGKAPYAAPSLEEAIGKARGAAPVDLAEAAPEAPPQLVAIVRRAMARHPGDRYQTAGELADALEATVAEALGRRGSPLVHAVASFAAGFGVLAMVAAIFAVFAVVSWKELGAAVLGYLIWPAIGCALSLIEIVTRGRYKLSPLSGAFIFITALSSVAGASTGVLATLGGVSDPAILADAEKWRTFVTNGFAEALGHIPVGCTFVGLQVMLWAVAKWLNTRTRTRTAS
jgi:predicted Ser/Thr protein kinase